MSRNKAMFVIVVLVVGFIFFGFTRKEAGQKPSTVTIQNLETCAPGINPGVTEEIVQATYVMVKSANDYNRKKTLPSYTATMRSGTCSQVAKRSFRGYDGGRQTVTTSSLILDVAEAKQSWKVQFDWVSDRNINTDLGTIVPECVPIDMLIYGGFNCEKILSKQQYGTDKYDPILPYVPYSGRGFDLTFNPETKLVSVIIHVPIGQKNEQQYFDNTKAVIPYWFQKRNLNITNYTLQYTAKYD